MVPQVAGTPDSDTAPIWFHSQFSGCMEMYASADRVSDYLDRHEGWFRRCAHPMSAEPLGENGYILTIGRFGALGYYVVPQIGLELLPQHDRVYRIETIPIPDYTPPGYEVDFQAEQILVDATPNDGSGLEVTRVEWELDLKVGVYFPGFVRKFPLNLIETTGHNLLVTIVKQVSRLLTHKVQEDFHSHQGPSYTQRFRTYSSRRQSFQCEAKPMFQAVTDSEAS
jgi:Protein of unknown function (DUF1997)